MICQRCGDNEATIHLVELIDGQRTSQWLCAECASRSGDDGDQEPGLGAEFVRPIDQRFRPADRVLVRRKPRDPERGGVPLPRICPSNELRFDPTQGK